MKNEIIKRITSIFAIIIFVLIIALPLVFINKDPNKISVVENKKLATFPKFHTDDLKLNIRFIREFESYVNDNIGFKQQAVISDIVAKYKLFHKVSIPNYIMGEDENLFYTSGGEGIKTFQVKNLYSESILNNLCKGFSYMRDFFQESGADFYMMTIPDKEGVYPELYPKSIVKMSDETRTDKLVDYIKENTDINVFNIKQVLIDNKGTDMLYYKNYDCTHWNMKGAFVGYQQIINQMQLDYPALKILSKDDFNINVEKTKGSLVHLNKFNNINNTMAFDDQIYNFNLIDGYKAELSSEISDGIKVDKADIYFHYVNKYNENMPKILIIGDSYLYGFLLPILAESFSELYFTNFTSANKLMKLQYAVNADIVLFEFVNRAFSESIYSELVKFENMKVKNYDFEKLPITDVEPVLNIDDPVVSDGTILINKDQEIQKIFGWSIDSKEENIVGGLYFKVGDSYYKSTLVERNDLLSIKKEYLMAGFQFEIPTKELIKGEYIEFDIISFDKTYRYKTICLKIKTK